MAITDEQIESLMNEAGAAGDDIQVKLCERALRGNRPARMVCERVIEEAQARSDESGRETIAKLLERLPCAEAMERANELCPESRRDQDWESGATTWFFDDGSALKTSGSSHEALEDEP